MGRRGPKPTPAIDRLMARIVLADVPFNGSVCWIWPGGHGPGGYGHVYREGRVAITHRVTYEHFVGPIPEGLVLDHLCRVTSCCNPAHLEAVTHLENVRRGLGGEWQRRRTHCPQGHPYSGSNLYSGVGRDGYVFRKCRACKNASSRRRRAEVKSLSGGREAVINLLPENLRKMVGSTPVTVLDD